MDPGYSDDDKTTADIYGKTSNSPHLPRKYIVEDDPDLLKQQNRRNVDQNDRRDSRGKHGLGNGGSKQQGQKMPRWGGNDFFLRPPPDSESNVELPSFD